MKSERKVKHDLRAWLSARAAESFCGTVSDDTPLIESGIINSLDVVELLLLIERLRGGIINVESLKPGAFSSLNAIIHNFFPEFGPEVAHDN